MFNTQILNAAVLLKELKGKNDLKLKVFCAERALSQHYMEQIGRRLVIAKLIKSRKGPGGGYRLAKEEISLADLVRTFKPLKTKDPLTTKALKALAEINVLD